MNTRISAAEIIHLYRTRIASLEDDLGNRVRLYLESKFPGTNIELSPKRIGVRLYKILSQNTKSDIDTLIESLFEKLESKSLSANDVDEAYANLITVAKGVASGATSSKDPVQKSTKTSIPEIDTDAIKARDFGNSLIAVLQRNSFLGEFANDSPESIGRRLISIAKYQLAGNLQKAYDAIQDLLKYYVTSDYDFTKRADNINQAILKVFGDLKSRSMSRSKSERQYKHKSDIDEMSALLWKKNKVESKSLFKGIPIKWTSKDEQRFRSLGEKLKGDGIDSSIITPKPPDMTSERKEEFAEEAFGTRSDSGVSEGGIDKIPEGAQKFLEIGDAEVDTLSGEKHFIKILQSHFPEIKSTLDDKEKLLFELIVEQGSGFYNSAKEIKKKDGTTEIVESKKKWSGSLLPGEEHNMNLGGAWKEACLLENPTWVSWYQDRPGRLTKLREVLLDKIQSYLDNKLPKEDYEVLYSTWNTSGGKVIDKDLERFQYERGRLERKKQKLEESITTRGLSPQEEAEIERYNDKFILEDEYGKLKYYDDIRELTHKEERRLEELPLLLKKYNVNLNSIPKIPPKTPTPVEHLMWLNKLEDTRALTPSLDILMDKVYDEVLDMFDGKGSIVRSIISEMPSSSNLSLLNSMAKGLQKVREEKVRIKDLPAQKEKESENGSRDFEDSEEDSVKKESIKKIKDMLAQIKRAVPLKYLDLLNDVKAFADGNPPSRLRDKNFWKDLEPSDFRDILNAIPGANQLLEESLGVKKASYLERIALSIM